MPCAFAIKFVDKNMAKNIIVMHVMRFARIVVSIFLLLQRDYYILSEVYTTITFKNKKVYRFRTYETNLRGNWNG